jgi:hypothetical protein
VVTPVTSKVQIATGKTEKVDSSGNVSDFYSGDAGSSLVGTLTILIEDIHGFRQSSR